MKLFKSRTLTCLALVCLCSCGANEIGTGVGNPPTSTTTKIAAAVTALFSSGSDSGSALIRNGLGVTVRYAGTCVGSPAVCLCDEIIEGVNVAPEGIVNGAFTDAGTYGSAARPITLASEDFCTLPNGTENPDAGPDGAGRYATFEIEEDVSVTCAGDSDTATFFLKSGSSGVHRNTDATNDAPEYRPQIYATFVISDGESEAPFDCTIFLLTNGTAEFVDCSDADGTSITQDADATCQFPSES